MRLFFLRTRSMELCSKCQKAAQTASLCGTRRSAPRLLSLTSRPSVWTIQRPWCSSTTWPGASRIDKEIVSFSQQNALRSSARVEVSEQSGAAPKPIPPKVPTRLPRFLRSLVPKAQRFRRSLHFRAPNPSTLLAREESLKQTGNGACSNDVSVCVEAGMSTPDLPWTAFPSPNLVFIR